MDGELPPLPPLPTSLKTPTKKISMHMPRGGLPPPPPPSIATSSSYSNSGFIFYTELETFILMCCLDYLKNSPKYFAHLSQGHPPNSTHHIAQISKVCQEIHGLVFAQVTPVSRNQDESVYEQKAVLSILTSVVDHTMAKKMTEPIPENESKLSIFNTFEVSATMPKLGVKSRTLVIQDFNSLFEIESISFRSMYGVFEAYNGSVAAEYVATHIPGHLANNIMFSTKTNEDPNQLPDKIKASFSITSSGLRKKNSLENTSYGAIGTFIFIEGLEVYLAWLGPVQAYLFNTKQNGDTRIIPLTKKTLGTLESIGECSDEEIIDEWLQFPETPSSLELQIASPTPYVRNLKELKTQTEQGEVDRIVLGSRSFWKTLNSEEVDKLITEFTSTRKSTPKEELSNFLLSKAKEKKPSLPSEELAVLVLTINL